MRLRTNRRGNGDDLILKADLALYQAKDAGRGVARYFSSEPQSEQDDRVRLESDLRSAVASKQFHLVFQPLINAKTQRLVGFEALIDGIIRSGASSRPMFSFRSRKSAG